MISQLPLPVSMPDQMTFETFLVGENSQLIQHLAAIVDDAGETNQITYISAAKASGKSHLLFALCHLADQQEKQSFYIDLQQHKELTPDVLENLTGVDIICLDNFHCIVGLDNWEVALFNLINNIKLSQCSHLVLCADQGPKQLLFNLPDLASRLTWGIAFILHAPDDENKVDILTSRAQARGMTLSTELSRFIFSHWQRDMHSLMASLDKLDRLSLEQKRRLTLPFIKQALDL